ncbi:MAG TPA: hypothetical protein VKB80_24285 [Kofleriaceae bacterium]|nr:hypothetical protein [Kofleriaceae bacterium]
MQPGSGPFAPGPAPPSPYGSQASGPFAAPGVAGPGMGQSPARGPVAPSWNPSPAAQPAWTPLAAYAPYEPWQRALRAVCLVFGLALVAVFLAPRSTDPLVFGWAVLQGELSAATIAALAVAALGLLAAVLALLPVSTGARALVAALAGTGAEVAGIALWPHIEWRLVAYAAGVLLAAAGLLVRSQYRASMLGRLVTAAGALAVLSTYVVPVDGEVPLLSAAKALSGGGLQQIAVPILILAIALAALVALVVVWLPPTTSAAGSALAWLLLVLPVAVLAAPILDQPAQLARDPAVAFHLLGVLATRALGAYGLASLAGKLLEDI